MKTENYKKTKREQVFEILNKQKYIMDRETAKIFGDKLWRVNEHIRIWKKLREDKQFFADKKIVEKRKGHRCHLVRVEGQEEGSYYKVGKEFFNTIHLSTPTFG